MLVHVLAYFYYYQDTLAPMLIPGCPDTFEIGPNLLQTPSRWNNSLLEADWFYFQLRWHHLCGRIRKIPIPCRVPYKYHKPPGTLRLPCPSII